MLPILLSIAIAAPVGPCPEAKTTVEMDTCLGKVSNAADVELARYLAAARKQAAADGLAVGQAFDDAQARWVAWRKAECDTLYLYWRSGTIRGAKYLSCRIDLTRARTRQLWQNWLTYPDSTPPILPEPPLSADAPS
ncbi:lysozyme inhibitor LprI family protein [Sphingomonas sp. HT-1]|uniref:lysozyme inhibitor LprI family protein n=1 Tax=unclassified Sphingomonas TaxID=196159 RepID=UPI00031AA898|nr:MULTISPECIES: lysozyme inhibitor LprI family protein [unclassified Sphingomonas]KTF68032.1 hypothetical protein ATB93_15760 [Sphingomonas sp. WG]